MNERNLKTRCIQWMKKITPTVWFYCPADRFHSGIPDIILCYRGQFGFVELKTVKGRVSEIQKWTHDEMQKSGTIGLVIRTLDDFENFMINDFIGKVDESWKRKINLS